VNARALRVSLPVGFLLVLSHAAVLLLAACAESSTNPLHPIPPGGTSALSPPWGISLSPGPDPSYNAITIQWGGITGATQYNLYESTSPNATLEAATKVANVNSPVTRSGLVAGQTYYYRLTSSGSGGESAPSVVVAGTASPDFTLLPLSPAAGAAVGTDDQLHIALRVAARRQLAPPITATIDGRTVTLALDANNDLTGSTPLAGLPVGATLLTFNVKDVSGSSAQAVVRFDILPSFQVTLPPPYSVARPTIHLQASCAPVACYSIGVANTGGASVYATGALDQTLSMASLDGQSVVMDFQMKDSLVASSSDPQYIVRVARSVWVESSTHLQDVMTVAGPIADASQNRVLYSSSQQGFNVNIHNAASPIDTFVLACHNSGQYPLLTPTGAWVWCFNQVHFDEDTLFNWDGGSLTNEAGYSPPVVSGDFGIFEPAAFTSLTRVTFSTRARAAVTPCSGGGDVAANGDVACANATGQIFRFRDGLASQVTHDTAPLFNLRPRTDGMSIVFTQSLTSSNNNTEPDGPYRIALLDSTGEHILTHTMSYSPGLPPEPTYRANNGWVAYTETSNTGELQAWALPPGGIATQITHFGGSSTIEALGPNGEVVLLNSSSGQSRRYLAVSPYTSVLDIASGQGHAFFEGDKLFVFIGPTLFRVPF